MKPRKEKLKDRIQRLASEGKTDEEIADQLIAEKNDEIKRKRK